MEDRGKQRKFLNSTFPEAMSFPSLSRTCSVPGSVSLRSCPECLAADRLKLLGLWACLLLFARSLSCLHNKKRETRGVTLWWTPSLRHILLSTHLFYTISFYLQLAHNNDMYWWGALWNINARIQCAVQWSRRSNHHIHQHKQLTFLCAGHVQVKCS